MKASTQTLLKKTAIEAALAAGKVIRKYFGKQIRIQEKKGAGLVTQADEAAEEIAVKILRKQFPQFGFLAEESGTSHSVKNPEGRWLIDPLDGTTNFVHGFPMFCVSIGAEYQGELELGVIYHPIDDHLYVGVRGKGANLNGKKLTVAKRNRLSDSLLTTGFAYQAAETLHQEIVTFEKISGIARGVRRPGSAAMDLAFVSRGIFDGFWERHLNPWDVAAGTVIVREAGGIVTDFKGNPFSVEMTEILAASRSIHGQLLSVIQSTR